MFLTSSQYHQKHDEIETVQVAYCRNGALWFPMLKTERLAFEVQSKLSSIIMCCKLLAQLCPTGMRDKNTVCSENSPLSLVRLLGERKLCLL